MARIRRAKFEDLLPHAWAIVDEWAKKWSERPLPVPLEELATAYKVRRIEFEPLLSTGGLEKEEDGFVVFINTEADGVEQHDADILEVSSDVWRELKSPLRFTLAHELAHLLLFRLAENEIGVFAGHEQELETTCNQMAGALLLPKPRFVHEIGNRLFDADHAKGLLANFRVSADAFVLRLQSPDIKDAFPDLEGTLTLLRARGNVLAFDAVHVRGPHAQSRWKRLVEETEEATMADLYLKADLLDRLVNSERLQEKTSVMWHPGANEKLRCELSMRRLRNAPLTILIGIRVVGHPEVEGEK